MRHESLEHHRNRVEPFEVVGPAKFIAASLGWSHDYLATALEDHLVSGQGVEVMVGDKRKPAVIVAWEMSDGTDQDATFKVKFHPLRPVQVTPASPAPDPWVKVGTTTIDGTLEQVAGAMLNGGKPSTLRPDTIEEFIDGRVRSQDPIHVGGRWLRLMDSHINGSRGTALIRCDVVRRQSEIDAETRARQQYIDETLALADSLAAIKPACPECGPHGNRGEVLLASSWARCTTCAGGKSGDLWGEVKPEQKSDADVWLAGEVPPLGETDDEYRQRIRSHFDPVGHKPGGGFPDDRFIIKESPELSGPLTVTIGGSGFKVPTLSEMHGAALNNLYRHFCGLPDGMSREEYRRIMFGEWAPEPIKIRITEL